MSVPRANACAPCDAAADAAAGPECTRIAGTSTPRLKEIGAATELGNGSPPPDERAPASCVAGPGDERDGVAGSAALGAAGALPGTRTHPRAQRADEPCLAVLAPHGLLDVGAGD